MRVVSAKAGVELGGDERWRFRRVFGSKRDQLTSHHLTFTDILPDRVLSDTDCGSCDRCPSVPRQPCKTVLW